MGIDVLLGEMVEGCTGCEEGGFDSVSAEWTVGDCWRWLGDE